MRVKIHVPGKMICDNPKYMQDHEERDPNKGFGRGLGPVLLVRSGFSQRKAEYTSNHCRVWRLDSQYRHKLRSRNSPESRVHLRPRSQTTKQINTMNKHTTFTKDHTELMLTRRGFPSDAPGHGSFWVTTRTFHSSLLMLELSFCTPCVGGIIACSNIRLALMMLAIPLAASLCPTFVLTEPRSRGYLRSSLNTRDNASTSIGSPTLVPVP